MSFFILIVDQTPITYTYNASGLRQSKTVNGNTTYFIYNNDLLVTQYDNSESYQFLYDENNMLFGFIRTDLTTNIKTQYFYIRRINGRIDGIMNASDGSIAVYYVCGAYGEIHQIYDYTTFGLGNKNPFRWMGYYYDNESNYYYCNSRYYNPEWGRWISPNSIEYLNSQSINGLNLYAYCKSSPVMKFDINGYLGDSIGVNLKSNYDVKLISISGEIDKNNTDIDVVKNADKISYYRGVKVIKFDPLYEGMTSFAISGTIFLSNDVSENELEDTLNHEYGHTIQEKEYGNLIYWIRIAIPSLIHRDPEGDYYSQPWEYGADLYGNVDRETYEEGAHEKWLKYHQKTIEFKKRFGGIATLF